MDEMKTLINTLNAASKAYYAENREIMSDREYDALYDKLLKLELKMGIVMSNSPTRKVGFDIMSGLNKIPHDTPMLSLDKTKSADELALFLNDEEGLLSWKLDGLTLVLKYDGGELIQAATRGNGEVGEIVTHNARVFANLPLTVPYKGAFAVRGEAVITFADFERINNTLNAEEQYKNPRNLVSGTVRQLNSEVCASRRVHFYAFGGGNQNTEGTKQAALDWLKSQGFDCVESVLVTKTTVKDAVKAFESRITDNPFATDGLVLTFNDIAYSLSLGRTSKFPKDSLAFKWRDALAETKLLKIEWNTSRTGLINPVAVFEPVELEGTTVTRAALHNISIIEGLNLKPGDTITVYKANMIIPQIAENLTPNGGEPAYPEKCPVCGEPSVLSGSLGTKFLYCDNPFCRAKLLFAIKHFVSREAMNIEGFSQASIAKFIERGFINSYADIYKLSRYKDEIIQMDGYGEKSYSNLAAAIEQSKTPELPNFIYSLGIPQVGLSNAKLLCRAIGGLDNIKNAAFEDLAAIDGFGEVISKAVYDYFKNETNLRLLDEALKFIAPKEKAPIKNADALSGLVFVITGAVEHFKNREELKNFIEQRGGKTSGAVSAKTSFLINNNASSASGKNKKAKELGIPIISEAEFMTYLKSAKGTF